MASPYPPRPSAASRKLLRELPSEEEIAHIAVNLQEHSDAAMVLVGCSCVQNALRTCIKSRFVQLSSEDEKRLFDGNQNGIISTFSSQLRISFAMGLIDKPNHDDMMLMNDIRNVFAHSIHPTGFTNPAIVADCDKLYMSATTRAMQKRCEDDGQILTISHARATFHNTIFWHFHNLVFLTKGIEIGSGEEFNAALQSISRKKYGAPPSS